jgi:hypothetical protein
LARDPGNPRSITMMEGWKVMHDNEGRIVKECMIRTLE